MARAKSSGRKTSQRLGLQTTSNDTRVGLDLGFGKLYHQGLEMAGGCWMLLGSKKDDKRCF